jgi:hypothetical protein
VCTLHLCNVAGFEMIQLLCRFIFFCLILPVSLQLSKFWGLKWNNRFTDSKFWGKSTCIASPLKIPGFETIQSLCRFKFFGVKVLVSLHRSKFLWFEAIQLLYRYFLQVKEDWYCFSPHFFSKSCTPLVL